MLPAIVVTMPGTQGACDGATLAEADADRDNDARETLADALAERDADDDAERVAVCDCMAREALAETDGVAVGAAHASSVTLPGAPKPQDAHWR